MSREHLRNSELYILSCVSALTGCITVVLSQNMQNDLVKMGVKVSNPQKHQKRMITLQKCPQQARLHLHDEPTEFDMLLLKT